MIIKPYFNHISTVLVFVDSEKSDFVEVGKFWNHLGNY